MRPMADGSKRMASDLMGGDRHIQLAQYRISIVGRDGATGMWPSMPAIVDEEQRWERALCFQETRRKWASQSCRSTGVWQKHSTFLRCHTLENHETV